MAAHWPSHRFPRSLTAAGIAVLCFFQVRHGPEARMLDPAPAAAIASASQATPALSHSAAAPQDVTIVPHGSRDLAVPDQVNGMYVLELVARNRRVVVRILPL